MVAQKPIKAMTPRVDAKYTGPEPDWRTQPEAEFRTSALTNAFTWYHYHFGKKEAKEIVIDWLMRNDRQRQAKDFGKVPESAVTCTWAWLARANLRGLQLLADEQSRLDLWISDNIAAHRQVRETVEAVEEAPNRITIQDRLREKAAEVGGELEGMLDDIMLNGVKITADHKPINIMRGMNVSPQHISVIRTAWVRHRDEFFDAMEGRDAQLTEAYRHLGKIQLRNLVKFADQVLADCDSYVQIKKVERKPRKKKPVSAEKLTARFKYLKEFAELKLTSEAATKLVGATEAWLYDTKKRKLIHVVADSHVQSLSVKGSAILGFDATNSVQKTLRKPAEQIKTLMSGGAPAARKFFKEIKSTEVKFNGRGNENLILLRIR